jgi:hypothetical protein
MTLANLLSGAAPATITPVALVMPGTVEPWLVKPTA